MKAAAAVRRWPARVGAWMTAHEVERAGRTRPKAALATVVSIYTLGYAFPIYAAIHYLSSAHIRHLARTSDGWSTRGIIELCLNVAALVPAIVVLAREAPSWSRATAPDARWLAELKSFGLAWAAIFAGSIASSALGIGSYPRGNGPGAAWPETTLSLLAGPTEEIIVLVLPLVLLRAAKRPWWQVIAIGLVLRIAYHVYYGFPAVGLLVWALAMMFIYLRTHAVIGMIVAHSYWDTAAAIGAYWSRIAAGLMFVIPLLSLLVWGFISSILWLVRRHERKKAAAAPPLPIGWYQNQIGYWWWWDGLRWIPAPPP